MVFTMATLRRRTYDGYSAFGAYAMARMIGAGVVNGSPTWRLSMRIVACLIGTCAV